MSKFFTNRPPDKKHTQNFPVIRSGKKWGQSFSGLCLSDRVFCAPTHFKGRSIGCLKNVTGECESCDAGWSPRWFGYIGIIHAKTKTRGMLELTERAANEAADFAEKVGSLRGYIIKVSRLNDRPNGALQIQFEQSTLSLHEVPQGFCVTEALARMWKIELSLITEKMGQEPTIEEMRRRGQLDEGDFPRHNRNGSAA